MADVGVDSATAITGWVAVVAVPVSCHQRHRAAYKVELDDAVVPSVCDVEEITDAFECTRITEPGGGAAGHGADRPAGTHFTDSPVARVRDEEVAATVCGNGSGVVELCRRRRPAVAGKTRHAGSGVGADRPRRIDFADALCLVIGDVRAPGVVHRDPLRPAEAARGG